MKKIITLAAMLCALTLNSNAQCIQQGKILVDTYYGFPNFYGLLFTSLVKQANTNAQGITTPSLGPMGIKVEYLLTDKFGLNGEFNYSSASINFSKMDTVVNYSTGQISLYPYHYSFTTPAIRAMIGFNFHFVRTEKVDVYGAVKAGFYHRSYNFTSDQPNYVSNLKIQGTDPFAFRLEIGMRYYFVENVGANLAIGVSGGPLVLAGISFKFGAK